MKCRSPNNQPCKARPTLVNVNSNEARSYPFTVCFNQCVGSCNTTDDSYAWAFVSNIVKNMNLKVFNLISEVNETRFLVQQELCECKCGLNESVCNAKQN